MKIRQFLFLFNYLFVVSLSFSQTTVIPEERQVINIGYAKTLFNEVDIRDASVAIKLWSDQLVTEFNNNYELKNKIFNSNQEIIDAFNNNNLDIINILSIDYLEIENETNLVPLLSSTEPKKKGFENVLLVRKDSRINRFGELQNKGLIYTPDNFSQLARVWISSLFMNYNISETKSFFSKITKAEKPSQAVLSVFFKNTDACVVPISTLDIMQTLNPQLTEELIVIEKSIPLVNGLICVRRDLDEKIKADLLTFVLHLPEKPNGKLLFSLFGVMELKQCDAQALFETKKLYESVRSLN